MNFKKLCSDPESLKTFTTLNDDLLKSGSFFAGGVDPDSILDMDDDALREAQNAYESLASAVSAMQGMFEVSSKATTNSTEKLRSSDRNSELQATHGMMLEIAREEEKKKKAKEEEDSRNRSKSSFEDAFKFNHL